MEPRTHARGNRAPGGGDRAKHGRFNGATHSRAWKHYKACLTRGRERGFMEPRTHARGNNFNVDSMLQNLSGFNGATHSRAWKHVCFGASVAIAGTLQWSHALTRVETEPVSPVMIPRSGLQWSHALTRVETDRAWVRVVYRLCASMEPRTHARGNPPPVPETK